MDTRGNPWLHFQFFLNKKKKLTYNIALRFFSNAFRIYMIILVILDVRGTNWLHFLSFFPHVGKIWPSLQLNFSKIWNNWNLEQFETIWNISWRGGRYPGASDSGKPTFLWVCLFVLKTYLCRRFHTQLTSICLPHKIFHVLIESPIQKCS